MKIGQRVTVHAIPGDPYILNFQRCGIVSEIHDDGVMIQLQSTWPPYESLGPIPTSRIELGWQNQAGRIVDGGRAKMIQWAHTSCPVSFVYPEGYSPAEGNRPCPNCGALDPRSDRWAEVKVRT